jgi:glucose/arabinose dehydrogenase
MSKPHLVTLLAATAAVLALVLWAGTAAGGDAATPRGFAFHLLASGFDRPVYVTSAPGDPSTLYVVEQAGRIEIVRNGAIAGTFLDIRSRVLVDDNERGLLSMAFHPGYAQNRLFYVDYTGLDGSTHVVQFEAANGVADPATARDLLVVEQPYPNHKGGQLQFDAKGMLYVGMGDGGTNPANGDTSIGDPENRAQSSASRLGKLLRIDPLEAGASWQTIGMGLRNPWRFSFDRQTGSLWIADVGAARFEEIDFRPKALVGTLANYGWSRFEGPSLYNPKISIPNPGRLVKPALAYSHAGGACGIIGGYVYRGAAVPAARGRYFFGDLCTGLISTVAAGPKGPASAAQALAGRIGSIDSFGEDASGELYAVTLDGYLFALR